MQQLVTKLDDIFVKKAPFALPENAKEWIVKYGPWITLVLIVMLAPVLLFALGLTAVFLPAASIASPGAGAGLAFAWVFLAISLLLDIAALPGLFQRKMSGWNLLFYATLFNAVYSLVTVNLFSLLINTAISLYFLMQIRTKYHQ